jgi:hypothetical protein
MATDIFDNYGNAIYPDFAVNTDGSNHDVVDPTSGKNNVIMPSSSLQLTGWLYKQKPPRNTFNWLHRLTTQWIRWLYGKVDGLMEDMTTAQGNISTLQGENATATKNVKITTSYLTVEQTATLYFVKRGKNVTVSIPVMFGISNSNALIIETSDSSDLPFFPTHSLTVFPCIVIDDTAYCPGQVTFGSSHYTLNFACLPAVSDGNKVSFGDTNFKTSGNKGVPPQFITYQTS